MQKIENYLTEKATAEITGFAVQTLRNHRHESRGIPYLVCGKRSIRYRPQDVKSYMEQCVVVPEAN
jgi:hypothetical protein